MRAARGGRHADRAGSARTTSPRRHSPRCGLRASRWSSATVADPTGVALILVDARREPIVVAPGANSTLAEVELPVHDAVLCQLEVSDAAFSRRGSSACGLFCLNAAPARVGDGRPDLTVVNRCELECCRVATGSSRSRSGRRARCCSTTARRSRGPLHRGRGRRRHCGGRRVHRLSPGVTPRRARAAASRSSGLRGGRDRAHPGSERNLRYRQRARSTRFSARRSSRARPRDASARRSGSSPRSSRDRSVDVTPFARNGTVTQPAFPSP